MKVVIDICKTCGSEFKKTGNNQKFCSSSCYTKHNYENYLKRWAVNNPVKMLLRGAKWRAKKKNLDFDLTENDIKLIDVCPILGIPLKINQTGKSGFYHNSYSLDRIDPTKGYVKGNVRVISNRANLIKSNATIEELEKVLEDARNH